MNVIVAIDSAQSAETALKFLKDCKYGPPDHIHLVHVIVPGFADAKVAGIPDVVAEERSTEQKLLDALSATIKNNLGAEVTTDILAGDVGSVIADVCRRFDADEVIVPSHARHGFSRLWFGSVADEIVDEAPCTVIVLKMPQTAR
ncbi:MAG TPA: universal stress protein [Candidatus Obscuribacterales bacterium]